MKKSNAVVTGLVGAAVVVGCSGPNFGSGAFSDSPQAEAQGGSVSASTAPAGPQGPAPAYGTTTTLANSPPPISGGTLVALADGVHVVAADSDRDRIYIVNLTTNAVTPVLLSARDEPGRVIEDSQGQVHVVLRGAGAIATIDVGSATLVARRNVCVSPRGIAFDSANARLVVACETGEVMTMPPASTGAATLLTTLGSGLRDVVVREPLVTAPSDAAIYVSRFRNAEVMKLAMDGTLVSTTRPSAPSAFNGAEATLAWRMLAPLSRSAAQDPIVVHQWASLGTVSTSPGGYTSGGSSGGVESEPPASKVDVCTPTSIVTSAVTPLGGTTTLGPSQLVVPVDFALTNNGYAVIAAGNGHTAAFPGVFIFAPGACAVAPDSYLNLGQPTAITVLANGSLVVQSREPAQLTVLSAVDVSPNGQHYSPQPPISLATSSESVEDTGHTIFHSNSGSGIACASCHGEGADDSHVWTFDTVGARRTPSLRGTINGTAPYHWDGTMTNIGMLADQVMTERMNGPQLTDPQKSALQNWLFAIPAPPLATNGNAATIAQGKALFESPSVGCSGCHSGPRFTNNTTVDVGTGGSFQVPPLVGVRARAPYLHNGCAKTLADRFGACATPQHGNISQLQSSDIDALVAYLESI